MSDPLFFSPRISLTLAEVIVLTGASVAPPYEGTRVFQAVAALDRAGPGSIAFCGHDADGALLAATTAGACFVSPHQIAILPSHTIALVTPHPARAFARIVDAFHPGAGRPASLFATRGINPAAFIHFEARLEADVMIDPGVVVGPKAEIGSGTIVGANSVIGPDVRIGRNCAIGAHVTIANALIGNEVVIGPGVRIGQDDVAGGVSADGIVTLVGLGRVIIQDGVAIGANATIDRGGLYDTIVGEGSRIGAHVAIVRDQTIERYSLLRRAPG